jgi:uncharacterized SAM-binding protein YcdF (DUF218 family)
VLDIALFGGEAKIQATMNEISSDRRLDSSGSDRKRFSTIATNALLGVLAGLLVAQLAPWGDGDVAGTSLSVFVGMVGGIATGHFLKPSLLVGLDVGLLAVYLLVAMTPIASLLTDRWVRVDKLPADTLDAVISLSAGVKSDSALNAVAADRLLSALELMRDGHGRRLVTTRQRDVKGVRVIDSDRDQRRLISLASLDRVWTVVDSVHTTREEAVHTAALLFPSGARSIVVVTSPMHTRRACAVFEAVGFRVFCQAARERDFVTIHPTANRDRLAALRAYGYELVGMVKYRFKGWLTPRPPVTTAPGGSS